MRFTPVSAVPSINKATREAQLEGLVSWAKMAEDLCPTPPRGYGNSPESAPGPERAIVSPRRPPWWPLVLLAGLPVLMVPVVLLGSWLWSLVAPSSEEIPEDDGCDFSLAHKRSAITPESPPAPGGGR